MQECGDVYPTHKSSGQKCDEFTTRIYMNNVSAVNIAGDPLKSMMFCV